MDNVEYTLLGAAVTFLATLFTIWQKNQHELEKLKLENNHKLTQTTYQELFKKKIDIYIELHKKLLIHNENLLSVGFIEYDIDEFQVPIINEITEDKINVDLLNNLNSYFIENLFYVSEEIERKFSNLNTKLQKNQKIFEYEIREGMIDYSNAEEIDKEMIKSFFNEHKKDIYVLINAIESEIRTIKNKIKFD